MIEFGFFNAVDNDRLYNADSFNEFFNGILSDTGVYKKSGNALKVTPGASGLSVKVQTGKARVKQHFVNVKSDETIALATSDIALNRYDAIVFRLDYSARTITLEVITGTSATTPKKPDIRRNENTFDLCLAYVYVPAGASSVTQSNIEDVREDEYLCSYVKMQIDAINAGIREYRNIVEITSEVTEIAIGIPQFDAENDLLFSNINGVMFVRDADYTVSGTGSSAKIVLNTSIKADNIVEFRVIKSIIEVL